MAVIRVVQPNPTVGDLNGNLNMILDHLRIARQDGVDVLLLPEMVTTGYPPRDLLYADWVWNEHELVIQAIRKELSQGRQMTVILGGLHETTVNVHVRKRYNAAYVLDNFYGMRIVHKRLLPQYDVFDETRYFCADLNEPFLEVPIRLSSGESFLCDVLICEDIWNNEFAADIRLMPQAYALDPIKEIAGHHGPLFVLNGSPYWRGKVATTTHLLGTIYKRLNRPVFWVNQVGAHDDLVFGGYSTVIAPKGITSDLDLFWKYQLEAFAEDQEDFTYDPISKHVSTEAPFASGSSKRHEETELKYLFEACVLHIRDYARRTGFKKAVLGLSGGVDSAVVAVIAAHALGPENVMGITMPSQYSSLGSVGDSEDLAHRLGIKLLKKPIGSLHQEVRSSFLKIGNNFEHPVTDENIQPRIRALLLMTYSNDHNALLLTTGNKSEISVGYCTLYGDTCGGIGVIGDLWKTEVYELAQYINRNYDTPIPQPIIEKPPSAELRPDQKDTDSLPSYPVLDSILRQIIEQELPAKSVVADCEMGTVLRVASMVARSEYKRQQMPLCPKLSQRSFGSGRRMPIACKISHVE